MSEDISGSTIFGTAVAVNTTTATGTNVPANAANGAYLDKGVGYFTTNLTRLLNTELTVRQG